MKHTTDKEVALHTPGEWKIIGECRHDSLGATLNIFVDNEDLLLCSVWGETPEEAAANAALIASAPTLKAENEALIDELKIKESLAIQLDKEKTKLANDVKVLREALRAVYNDIELNNVKGGSDELNVIVSEALRITEQPAKSKQD